MAFHFSDSDDFDDLIIMDSLNMLELGKKKDFCSLSQLDENGFSNRYVSCRKQIASQPAAPRSRQTKSTLPKRTPGNMPGQPRDAEMMKGEQLGCNVNKKKRLVENSTLPTKSKSRFKKSTKLPISKNLFSSSTPKPKQTKQKVPTREQRPKKSRRRRNVSNLEESSESSDLEDPSIIIKQLHAENQNSDLPFLVDEEDSFDTDCTLLPPSNESAKYTQGHEPSSSKNKGGRINIFDKIRKENLLSERNKINSDIKNKQNFPSSIARGESVSNNRMCASTSDTRAGHDGRETVRNSQKPLLSLKSPTIYSEHDSMSEGDNRSSFTMEKNSWSPNSSSSANSPELFADCGHKREKKDGPSFEYDSDETQPPYLDADDDTQCPEHMEDSDPTIEYGSEDWPLTQTSSTKIESKPFPLVKSSDSTIQYDITTSVDDGDKTCLHQTILSSQMMCGNTISAQDIVNKSENSQSLLIKEEDDEIMASAPDLSPQTSAAVKSREAIHSTLCPQLSQYMSLENPSSQVFTKEYSMPRLIPQTISEICVQQSRQPLCSRSSSSLMTLQTFPDIVDRHSVPSQKHQSYSSSRENGEPTGEDVANKQKSKNVLEATSSKPWTLSPDSTIEYYKTSNSSGEECLKSSSSLQAKDSSVSAPDKQCPILPKILSNDAACIAIAETRTVVQDARQDSCQSMVKKYDICDNQVPGLSLRLKSDRSSLSLPQLSQCTATETLGTQVLNKERSMPVLTSQRSVERPVRQSSTLLSLKSKVDTTSSMSRLSGESDSHRVEMEADSHRVSVSPNQQNLSKSSKMFSQSQTSFDFQSVCRSHDRNDILLKGIENIEEDLMEGKKCTSVKASCSISYPPSFVTIERPGGTSVVWEHSKVNSGQLDINDVVAETSTDIATDATMDDMSEEKQDDLRGCSYSLDDDAVFVFDSEDEQLFLTQSAIDRSCIDLDVEIKVEEEDELNERNSPPWDDEEDDVIKEMTEKGGEESHKVSATGCEINRHKPSSLIDETGIGDGTHIDQESESSDGSVSDDTDEEKDYICVKMSLYEPPTSKTFKHILYPDEPGNNEEKDNSIGDRDSKARLPDETTDQGETLNYNNTSQIAFPDDAPKALTDVFNVSTQALEVKDLSDEDVHNDLYFADTQMDSVEENDEATDEKQTTLPDLSPSVSSNNLTDLSSVTEERENISKDVSSVSTQPLEVIDLSDEDIDDDVYFAQTQIDYDIVSSDDDSFDDLFLTQKQERPLSPKEVDSDLNSDDVDAEDVTSPEQEDKDAYSALTQLSPLKSSDQSVDDDEGADIVATQKSTGEMDDEKNMLPMGVYSMDMQEDDVEDLDGQAIKHTEDLEVFFMDTQLDDLSGDVDVLDIDKGQRKSYPKGDMDVPDISKGHRKSTPKGDMDIPDISKGQRKSSPEGDVDVPDISKGQRKSSPKGDVDVPDISKGQRKSSPKGDVDVPDISKGQRKSSPKGEVDVPDISKGQRMDMYLMDTQPDQSPEDTEDEDFPIDRVLPKEEDNMTAGQPDIYVIGTQIDPVDLKEDSENDDLYCANTQSDDDYMELLEEEELLKGEEYFYTGEELSDEMELLEEGDKLYEEDKLGDNKNDEFTASDGGTDNSDNSLKILTQSSLSKPLSRISEDADVTEKNIVEYMMSTQIDVAASGHHDKSSIPHKMAKKVPTVTKGLFDRFMPSTESPRMPTKDSILPFSKVNEKLPDRSLDVRDKPGHQEKALNKPKTSGNLFTELIKQRSSSPSCDHTEGMINEFHAETGIKSSIQRESTSHVTKPESTAHVTKPESTSHVTKPESTAHVTKPESTSRVTKPESTSHVTKPESTSRVTKPESTSRVTKPESTSRVTKPESTSHVTKLVLQGERKWQPRKRHLSRGEHKEKSVDSHPLKQRRKENKAKLGGQMIAGDRKRKRWKAGEELNLTQNIDKAKRMLVERLKGDNVLPAPSGCKKSLPQSDDLSDVEMPCTQEIMDHGLPILNIRPPVSKKTESSKYTKSDHYRDREPTDDLKESVVGQQPSLQAIQTKEDSSVASSSSSSFVPSSSSSLSLTESSKVGAVSSSLHIKQSEIYDEQNVMNKKSEQVRLDEENVNMKKMCVVKPSSPNKTIHIVSSVQSISALDLLSSVPCENISPITSGNSMNSDSSDKPNLLEKSAMHSVAHAPHPVTDRDVLPIATTPTCSLASVKTVTSRTFGTMLRKQRSKSLDPSHELKRHDPLTQAVKGILKKEGVQSTIQTPKLRVHFDISKTSIKFVERVQSRPLLEPSIDITTKKVQREPMKPFRTQNEFIWQLLKWNPVWICEQSNEKHKGEMPPLLGPNQKACRLREYYDDIGTYQRITYNLFLLEVWAMLSHGWHSNQSYIPVVIRTQPFYQKGDEHFGLLTIIVEGVTTDVHIIPFTSDVLVLDMKGTVKTKDQAIQSQQFGFVESVQRTRVNANSILHKPQIKENFPDLKNPRATMFTVQLKMKFKGLVPFDLMKIKKISSLTTALRQFQGLVELMHSPLCEALVNPDPDSSVFSLDDLVDPEQNLLKYLNREQALAVTMMREAIVTYPKHPRVCLLQGPPGTGKSHTIVVLIHQILMRTRFQARICLAAPSNAAVDEIARKIVDMSEKRCRPQNSPLISLVRVGSVDSVAKEMKPFHIQSLVEQHLKDQIKKLPQSLQDELKAVESKISSLTAFLQRTDISSAQKVSKQTELNRLRVKDLKKIQEEMGFSPSDRMKAKYSVINNCHVVCGTLSSFGSGEAMTLLRMKNTDNRREAFTCLIVDEVTQAVEMDCLIPLQHHINKLVLVGDQAQLPATVLSQEARDYRLDRSLFERLHSKFDCDENVNPVMMLKEQFRMHPEIVKLPNAYFYDNQLTTAESCIKSRTSHLRPYLVFDVVDSTESCGSHDNGSSKSNLKEAKCVVSLCQRVVEVLSHSKKNSGGQCQRKVGVICPYSDQRTLIVKKLRDVGLLNITVNTVDSFQGQEKDVIIMSCVRAQENPQSVGFIDDSKRMNVALTRARLAHYIIGNYRTLRTSKLWSYLYQDAKDRNLLVTVAKTERFTQMAAISKKDKI